MNQKGRSMVEMLGVLAIVGVLSVGAISGYSKAMMKYKLNIQAREMNYLINLILEYKDRIKTSHDNLGKTFARMNILPEHFTVKGNFFYDIMNNKVNIFKLYVEECAHNFNCNYFGLQVYLQPEDDLDECRNLLKVAQLRHEDLYFSEREITNSASDQTSTRLYGDLYCNKNNECLRDLTIARIGEICKRCDGSSCSIRFIFTGY